MQTSMTWQEFVLMWRPCPHNKGVMDSDWNSLATKTRWLQMRECVNSRFPFPYTLYPARREVQGELNHRPCCRFMSQSIQCDSAVLLLCPFCVNTIIYIYTLGEHATVKKRCPVFDKKAWRLLWLMNVVSVYWWWSFMQRFMHVMFEINGKVLPLSCFVLCLIVTASKVLLLFHSLSTEGMCVYSLLLSCLIAVLILCLHVWPNPISSQTDEVLKLLFHMCMQCFLFGCSWHHDCGLICLKLFGSMFSQIGFDVPFDCYECQAILLIKWQWRVLFVMVLIWWWLFALPLIPFVLLCSFDSKSLKSFGLICFDGGVVCLSCWPRVRERERVQENVVSALLSELCGVLKWLCVINLVERLHEWKQLIVILLRCSFVYKE